MKAARLALSLSALLLACVTAAAQSPPAAGVKRFDSDGLSFDYPAGWELDDKSGPEAQRLVLTRAGSSALIILMAYRERVVTSEQAQAARDQITTPIVEDMARRMGAAQPLSWESPACQEVGDKRVAVGFRLGGKFEEQPGIAEVYGLVYARRYLNFIYVRSEKDDAAASAAWKQVLGSLRVAPPPDATPEGDSAERAVLGGVLDGKVARRVAPRYPAVAMSTRAQGTVTVQVEVNELGHVLTAKAVAGPPLLRLEAERSVSQWKFTPTMLCGKPVRVTGTVTISFVFR